MQPFPFLFAIRVGMDFIRIVKGITVIVNGLTQDRDGKKSKERSIMNRKQALFLIFLMINLVVFIYHPLKWVFLIIGIISICALLVALSLMVILIYGTYLELGIEK